MMIPELIKEIGEDYYATLQDDVELLDGAGAEFDLEKEYIVENYHQYVLVVP